MIQKTNRGWRGILSGKMKEAGRVAVLGVGNADRGDDAAGLLLVRGLEKDLGRLRSDRFLILDGGETPENLTGEIRKFGPDLVVIVDAATGGYEPGMIHLVDREKISEDDLSTHRIPLSHLIRYLEESIGCRVLLVGIEPRRLASGESPSREIQDAVLRLADELTGYLRLK